MHTCTQYHTLTHVPRCTHSPGLLLMLPFRNYKILQQQKETLKPRSTLVLLFVYLSQYCCPLIIPLDLTQTQRTLLGPHLGRSKRRTRAVAHQLCNDPAVPRDSGGQGSPVHYRQSPSPSPDEGCADVCTNSRSLVWTVI